MASYLFIESRDPFEFRDVEESYGLAASMAAKGSAVTVFLVQNGVLAARQGAQAGQFASLASQPGVTVLADTYALQERGMDAEALTAGVKTSDMDALVDLLMVDGQKAIWH